MKSFILGYCLLILSFVSTECLAQNFIQGTFPNLANQTVKLLGHEGFDTYIIESVKANDKGEFKLNYAPKDYGMGFLQSEDEKQFSLIIANEKIVLEGIDIATVNAINTVESVENKIFEQYIAEHLQREQTLAGWDYLKRIYLSEESLYSTRTEPKEVILKERKRIQQEDKDFLENLPKDSYSYWYLPIRKLISSVSTIAQYRAEEIPETTEAFRKIDYSDNRLYKSGMLNDVLESQIWFIENSGYETEEMYQQMRYSIDAVLESLVTHEKRYNEVVDRVFKILEKRSLYPASEYLALKVLNDQSCTLDSDLANQLESYRAMKIGNTAPDIIFTGDVIAPSYKERPKKLSDLQNNYTVVVFGASWCPACQEEFLSLRDFYSKWKEQGVEVVFISLDTEKELFKNFSTFLPFISVCDYKKWENKAVEDYHVFATPTLFLLDKEQKIILRPNSIHHMDTWVDWYLVEGNPFPRALQK